MPHHDFYLSIQSRRVLSVGKSEHCGGDGDDVLSN